MNICIVTPSAHFARSSHRYPAVAQAGRQMGVSVSLVAIDLINGLDFEHDLYVFAETFSVYAIVLACRIHRSGKLVAVDIALGYSGEDNERHRRAWLSAIDEYADFYLCGAVVHADTIHSLLGKDAKCFLAPSPAPSYNPNRLAHLLHSKILRTMKSRKIRLLWFDDGEELEPIDAVQELVGYGTELKSLARGDWTAELTVLVNPNCRGADHLAQLLQLPVPYTVKEWSPECETFEIERHFACFLPVSVNRFNRHAGLARAVSAFIGGSQVVAPGFPLYQDFGKLVLDSAAELLPQLINGRLPLQLDDLSDLAKKLAVHANHFQAVEAMLLGMETARSNKRKASAAPGFDIGVIHATASIATTNQTTRKHGELSVKSPLCWDELGFDVRIDLDGGRLKVLVDEAIVDQIPSVFHHSMKTRRIKQARYAELDPTLFEPSSNGFGYWHLSNRAAAIAAKSALLRETLALCRQLFPQTKFYINDHGSLVATKERSMA